MKKKILCILLLIFAVKVGASTGRSIYNLTLTGCFQIWTYRQTEQGWRSP